MKRILIKRIPKIFVIVIMILIFSKSAAFALQNESIKNENLLFEHISTNQGLSQSTVSAIIQDSKGFMWFGTGDGLNKYDGYKFTEYKQDFSNTNSISNNYINALYEDSQGFIWIGTDNGLNKYDRVRDIFTRYYSIPGNPKSLSDNCISSICEDGHGNIWIGTINGLCKFDKTKSVFTRYTKNNLHMNSISDNSIDSICKDEKGNLWIGTDKGLNYFDIIQNKFKNYYSGKDVNIKNNLVSNEFDCLYIDKKNILWIGTDKGLISYDSISQSYKSYKSNINSNAIYCIDGDSSGNLWLGTEGNGIQLFNRETKKFTNFKHDTFDANSISGNTVYSIYEDRYGVLWLGTYRAGINKMKKVQFVHYKNNPLNKNSLSDNNVHKIYEDSTGLLWIGTESGGLNVFDRKKNTFTSYKHDSSNPYSISSDSVWAIFEDHEGQMWIGTYEGLDKFNKNTNTFTHYTHDPGNKHSISNNYITAILEDKNNNLWICTRGGGLNKFDKKNNDFIHYTHDPSNKYSINNDYIWSIIEGSDHNLWIGTEGNGIEKFDINTGKFHHFLNNSNEQNYKILSIYEDASHTIWFGTWGGGLNKFNPSNNKLIKYTDKNGLPNNVVYGILEDDNKKLWLSTNKGIVKFNPGTGEVCTYDENYGIQDIEFNIGAYCKTKDKEMIFGGVDGFNIFNPNTFKDIEHHPNIVLTDFKKFNKSIQFNKDVSYIDSIPLTYKDNTITFIFAALDYTNPSGTSKYKYMLEGFDKEWLNAGVDNFATYTNIPSGSYTFKVRYLSNNKIFSQNELSIIIKISSPPWKSWWAYCIYTIFIITGIFLFIKYCIKKQSVKLEKQLQKFIEGLSSTLNLQEVCNKFLNDFKQIFPYDTGIILLKKNDSFKVVSMITSSEKDNVLNYYTDRMKPLIAKVIESKTPILINDILKNKNFKTEKGMYNFRSWLGIPIIYLEQVKEIVIFQSKIPGIFKLKVGLALAFAGQASIAMENARLFDELNRSKEDMENLLDNAGQGFLSFNNDLIIQKEHSLECNVILETEVKGRKITDLLYENDKDQYEFVEKVLLQVLNFSQDSSKDKIYLSLLPDEVNINNKQVHIDYKLIKCNNKKLKTMMMILTDITEKRFLENKMEEEHKILRMVVKVITHYSEFMEITKDYKNFCNNKLFDILKSNESLEKIISEIFINIHTFKGNFSQIEMIHTPERLHDFENRLTEIKNNINSYTVDSLNTLMENDNLVLWIQDDWDILKDILGDTFFSNENLIKIEKSKLIEIENRIERFDTTGEAEKLILDLKRLRYKSFKELLKAYPEYSLKLAERLEKQINLPIIEGEDIYVEPEKYHDFIRALVHVFRNALDHGIETEEERILRDKEYLGNIKCCVELKNDKIILAISDDGKGIDIQKLKEKAVINGLYTKDEISFLSNNESLNLIFIPGISTKDAISDISGRGVGLSSVKAEVEKLDGSIEIETILGKGTTFRFVLPYEIG